jgi:hypothetical protein
MCARSILSGVFLAQEEEVDRETCSTCSIGPGQRYRLRICAAHSTVAQPAPGSPPSLKPTDAHL